MPENLWNTVFGGISRKTKLLTAKAMSLTSLGSNMLPTKHRVNLAT